MSLALALAGQHFFGSMWVGPSVHSHDCTPAEGVVQSSTDGAAQFAARVQAEPPAAVWQQTFPAAQSLASSQA
jgi:hypothetical protein